MAKGAVRLRALEIDLKVRIERAEAKEAQLLKRVEALRWAEEELRSEREELAMLLEMLRRVEKKDHAESKSKEEIVAA